MRAEPAGTEVVLVTWRSLPLSPALAQRVRRVRLRTPEEVAAKVAALGVRAATVKDNLGKVSALSDGPLGEAVGEMNMKADALSESLTLAVAEGQEDIGPKITAAQEELTTAFDDVSTKAEAVCPAG